MHELSDKMIKLDQFFIKVRVPNYDFKGSFSFNIKDALENTGIQDKDELIDILNKLRDDPVLDVNGYDRPLIRRYRIIGENITIHGCKTIHIEDHIKEIKESQKRQKTNSNSIKVKSGLKKSLPDDAIWQDLTFRLMNELEVKILYKNKDIGIYSNETMGMYKGADKKPTVAWKFFVALINLGGATPSRKSNEKKSEKYRQWKKSVADILMNFVAIKEDPFEDAQASGKYKVKFKVEAEPELRGDGELYGLEDKDDNNPYNDLKDVYEDITYNQ